MPDLPGQVYTWTDNQVTYRTLLFNIFFHPKLAMALFAAVNRFWIPTLCSLLMLCMLGGCGIAMSRVPDYAADIRQTTDFLLQTVGPITAHNGLLDWAPHPEGLLPATHRGPHLRVDIVENRADFDARSLTDGERAGLVVAHDGLRFWRRLPAGTSSTIPEATIPPRLLQTIPDVQQLEEQAKARQENLPAARRPFTLDERTQPQVCKLVFLSLFFAVLIEQFIEIGTALLSSVLVMAVTIAFCFRIRKVSSFFALLLFTLNAIIPPAIAAVIYLIAELGRDFHSMLVIMTSIYVVYALFEGRNGKIIQNFNQQP
ncbi:MAG: hypothetical protein J6Y80_03710 [Victivallales bacterium]|nr:hypothetical protein [Victivallales bacterium]